MWKRWTALVQGVPTLLIAPVAIVSASWATAHGWYFTAFLCAALMFAIALTKWAKR